MKSDVAQTGPPLEYSRAALQAWTRGEELQERWAEFIRVAGPFVGQVVGKIGRKGWRGLKREDMRELARSAREGMERLGPTYIKMGQMLSVRGDVVGEDVRAELSRLQDAVRADPHRPQPNLQIGEHLALGEHEVARDQREHENDHRRQDQGRHVGVREQLFHGQS